MLCFFIIASKDFVFLIHFDSKLSSFSHNLQCLSVFLLFYLVSLSTLRRVVASDGLGPLFCLLFWGWSFFGFLGVVLLLHYLDFVRCTHNVDHSKMQDMIFLSNQGIIKGCKRWHFVNIPLTNKRFSSGLKIRLIRE